MAKIATRSAFRKSLRKRIVLLLDQMNYQLKMLLLANSEQDLQTH